MTQEDKQLLLRDLCARLPYKVKVYHPDYGEPQVLDTIFTPEAYSGGAIQCNCDDVGDEPHTLEDCRPYLRPMESMTENEKVKYLDLLTKYHFSDSYDDYIIYDWLNKKMFDFRGLISKGGAIKVTEENNPYKD